MPGCERVNIWKNWQGESEHCTKLVEFLLRLTALVDIQVLPYLMKSLAQLILKLPKDGQHLICLFKTGIKGSSMMKASLGSIECITSLCNLEAESIKIMEAAKTSYGSDFVQAALSVDKKVTLLHFEDEPPEGVLDVIASLLRKARLRLIMLTGDLYGSAWRIAKAMGIKEVYYSLKPEDKLNYWGSKMATDDEGTNEDNVQG